MAAAVAAVADEIMVAMQGSTKRTCDVRTYEDRQRQGLGGDVAAGDESKYNGEG